MSMMKWFRNLSLIVLLCLICIYLVFLLNIRYLTQSYERELYQANAESLSYVEASVRSKVQELESISTNMIADAVIQDNLFEIREEAQEERVSLAKRDIYNALYAYTYYNHYIRSINIILEDGSNICMGSSEYITRFDLESLTEQARQAAGRIRWETGGDETGDAVLYRQIRQKKYLTFEKLADLYLVVDMERLAGDVLKEVNYIPENAGFLLYQGSDRLYAGGAGEEWFGREFIDRAQEKGSAYQIEGVNGEEKFIITGRIPEVGWDYIFYRNYDDILRDVRLVRRSVLLVNLLFAAGIVCLLQIMLKGVLKHLGLLVDRIQSFGKTGRADGLSGAYDYAGRKDEIGQLHRSFDEMTVNNIRLRDENYEKQLLLHEATIKMLRQQISPHFLYNTLDTINWMAQKNGMEDVSVMARSLASLFRAAVGGVEDVIPLAEELTVLNHYIRIQEIRFGDRFRFTQRLPEDVSMIRVPKLSIQPLVENALRYAMEEPDEICSISLTVTELLDAYEIKVENTGSQFEEDLIEKLEQMKIVPHGSGVGLININSRLKLLYGEECGLAFRNEDGRAIVSMKIPKTRKAPDVKTVDCG